jgi:urease accessory protein
MTVEEIVAPAPRPADVPSSTAVPKRAAGVRAHACVATALRTTPSGHTRTVVSTLRSEAPLALRLTRAKTPEPWAADATDVVRVCVAAGLAGPVGGDVLALDVEVGPGSALVLAEISPTLALPGPHAQRSQTTTRIHVAAHGTLIWLAEPIVAVRGCDHVNEVHVQLEEGARFLMREEVLLGRHGEPSGTVRQHVHVRLGDRPLYRHDLTLGRSADEAPSVVGSHHAVGSILVVDPAWRMDWTDHPPSACLLPGDAALLPLEGPAALITALSPDSLALRRQLQAGLTALGGAWNPSPHQPPVERELI